jgi:hypothetical protein
LGRLNLNQEQTPHPIDYPTLGVDLGIIWVQAMPTLALTPGARSCALLARPCATGADLSMPMKMGVLSLRGFLYSVKRRHVMITDRSRMSFNLLNGT